MKVWAGGKLGMCTFEVEVRMCLSLRAQLWPQKWLSLPSQRKQEVSGMIPWAPQRTPQRTPTVGSEAGGWLNLHSHGLSGHRFGGAGRWETVQGSQLQHMAAGQAS